jgi:hypothetical protein
MTQVLSKNLTPYLNCFTGCLTHLAHTYGSEIQENQILEKGLGFLFQASLDEYGWPEYAFSVNEIGLLGMRKLGFNLETSPFETSCFAESLKSLVQKYGGVLLWVNTIHLDYSDLFRSRFGYLHTVLICEVSDDLTRARIYDSFVTEKENFAYEAWISIESLVQSATDKVRSKEHDHMGFFYYVKNRCPVDETSTCENLKAQAELFFKTPIYKHAISNYAKLCFDRFNSDPESLRIAARRLFQHVQVLCVVPGLSLFLRTLKTEKLLETQENCQHVTMEWKALALMSLKLEATGSEKVKMRIQVQFSKLNQLTEKLWASLLEKQI